MNIKHTGKTRDKEKYSFNVYICGKLNICTDIRDYALKEKGCSMRMISNVRK